MGSRYKKRRKFWCIMIKIHKLNRFEQYQKTFLKSKNSINVAKSLQTQEKSVKVSTNAVKSP
jgi:hypothetical protein